MILIPEQANSFDLKNSNRSVAKAICWHAPEKFPLRKVQATLLRFRDSAKQMLNSFLSITLSMQWKQQRIR